MEKLPWVIHLVADGQYCEECGEYHEGHFLEYMCDAHTHGLTEKFKHKEFQLVLHLDAHFICYVLNTLGRRVQEGEEFTDNQIVYGVLLSSDNRDVPVKLKEINGCLRVILPDSQFLFPDDEGCEYPYNLQEAPTDMLTLEDGTSCKTKNNN